MKVGKDIHILIVEDDLVQSTILADKINENYTEPTISQFDSGEKMLAFLKDNKKRQQKYYLILDYFLQTEENKDVANGIEIIKLMQKSHADVRIVIFSAYENDDTLIFKDLVIDHENVIGAVKKSDFAFSTLKNHIRFNYMKRLYLSKKKRFFVARYIFIAIVLAAAAYHFLVH